jgi:hypothetical protein
MKNIVLSVLVTREQEWQGPPRPWPNAACAKPRRSHAAVLSKKLNSE